MLRHIVMMKFKEDASQEKIKALLAGGRKLPEQIPEIVSSTNGTDLGLSQGKFDYAVVVDFASEADYKTYLAHPAHQALGAIVMELIADAAQIQFSY